jgi:molecular chaperone DnaK
MTRAKLEQLSADLFNRLRGPCEAALDDAREKLRKRGESLNIAEVVMVGGSTRIPKVQEIAKEIFKRDVNKSINPDEVVAVGAAIQGGILNKEEGLGDMVLLDVTPLSLGVETLGSVMTKLIERNATIPTAKKEVFSTAADSQSEVTIHVLQGEREFAQDNRTLGRFNLTEIAPAPRGVPQIEVSFDIDANGILNVSAKDMATSKQQSIKIEGSSGLSTEDVDRMTKEAESHSADDKKRRELVDIKNQADQLAYQTDKQLAEFGEKVPGDVRGKIESAVSSLREAAKGDDAAAIRAAIDNLQKIAQEMGKAAYAQAAEAQQAAEAAGDQPTGEAPAPDADASKKPPDEDVIDADFEVKE